MQIIDRICLFFCSLLSVCRPAEWALKLDALVALAGKRVEERKKELMRKAGAGPQAQADVHRHIRLWSLRLQLYCRMRENFQKTGEWSEVSFFNYSSGYKLDHSPCASLWSSLLFLCFFFPLLLTFFQISPIEPLHHCW